MATKHHFRRLICLGERGSVVIGDNVFVLVNDVGTVDEMVTVDNVV